MEGDGDDEGFGAADADVADEVEVVAFVWATAVGIVANAAVSTAVATM